jgi:predicted dehydrogenase
VTAITVLASRTEHEPARAERSGRAAPRLGFLGVGWIGLNRMKAIADAGFATVAAIAEPASEAANRAHQAAPTAEIVTGFDELLESDIDGVVIATPSALHAEQSIRALKNGVAVFCQKPLARSAEETQRVIDAARAADKLLGVDLSYRHTSGMKRIRELLQSASLGKILSVDLVFHNAYGPDKPWFYDRTLAGGGCVMDLGVHLLDLMLWSLDFPKCHVVSSALFSNGERITRSSDKVEDFALANLELESGASAQLACSWKANAGREAVISATFLGTRGGASFHNVNGSFYDFTAELFHGTSREVLTSPPDDWGGRAAVEWSRALALSSRFDPSIQGVVESASLIDAVYKG